LFETWAPDLSDAFAETAAYEATAGATGPEFYLLAL